MELKSFVDFAYSMVNMDEVKEGKFPLPKEIVFNLNSESHREIHREIQKEIKKDGRDTNLDQEFEVEIFNINFKFLENDI
jgi:hypothetical protein